MLTDPNNERYSTPKQIKTYSYNNTFMQKENTPLCPKCGSFDMKYMSHIKMYGGYICPECKSIWGSDEIKKR